MSDRALRFAARMIAIGLLGVAWTIGTLTMALALPLSTDDSRRTLVSLMGLAPVAVLLLYVVVTDFADWRKQKKQQSAQDDE